MNPGDIVNRLESLSDPVRVKGMERAGIIFEHALGVPLPDLRRLASEIGPDHELALELWDQGIREARIIAGLIDEPELVTEVQMELWAGGFENWEICDQSCNNLFRKTAYAWKKAEEWVRREKEFVKRAGFVLAAVMAVGKREPDDARFESFLPLIREGAQDNRNYVKKGVDWALRQIGKRNRRLNSAAVDVARELGMMKEPGPSWISSNTLRELTGDAVQKRLIPGG